MSKRDIDFGIVGDRFLALCSQDATCSSRFKKPNNLPQTLRGILTEFENNPNSTCASLMKEVKNMEEYPPSTTLSITLGAMLMDEEQRKLIPPVVYRLKRCETKDVDVLRQFINVYNTNSDASSQDDSYYSPLLFNLIQYSEMWEIPQPSMAEMKLRAKNALLTTGVDFYPPEYCAFSKEKSQMCDEFNYSTYAEHGIVYERDQYWNKTAKIPSQASVLLLSSKLDAQTTHEYAENLLETLDGNKKELVTFNTSIHGALVWTFLDGGDTWTPTCGVKIVASYAKNKGNLKGLDKSCIAEMPLFNLTVPLDYQISMFSADDVYEGAFNSSLSEAYYVP
ncbi:unnamed protein product [Phytophthora fragariaefolia]|uniref:Unnamed protein product n=1 Tax=Phytophthora fragariaefolia TaxID=1490495 RepID=A0A9W6YI18_9STRA|nr:unnamed protein product [Phytophthora fragariaefolia]